MSFHPSLLYDINCTSGAVKINKITCFRQTEGQSDDMIRLQNVHKTQKLISILEAIQILILAFCTLPEKYLLMCSMNCNLTTFL